MWSAGRGTNPRQGKGWRDEDWKFTLPAGNKSSDVHAEHQGEMTETIET